MLIVPRRKLDPASFSLAQFSPALVLDAIDLATIILVNGFVSQWNDKSGNNRHVTQGTPANRPAYTSLGLNGLNVVTFDGINDGLASSFSPLSLTSQSVFAVARRNATASFMRFVTQTTSGNEDYSGSTAYIPLITGGGGGNGLPSELVSYCNPQIGSLNTRSSIALASGTWVIAQSIHSGSAIINSVNATAGPSGAHSLGTFDVARFGIGFNPGTALGGYLNGAIAEVIVLPYAASVAIAEKIQGYLAHKWGLTAGLPANHPYKTARP